MIEPSQARYRQAVAIARLANALGIQLLPTHEDCVCLERLAAQAERWALLDACSANPTRDRAYHQGHGSDKVEDHEQA